MSDPPTEPEGELSVMRTRHERPPSTVAKLFGAMLMAVGGLITLLCGLCSATILVTTLGNIARYPGNVSAVFGMISMVAIFGGVPIALGVGVFLLGRTLYRGR